jgi:hypothetical protein
LNDTEKTYIDWWKALNTKERKKNDKLQAGSTNTRLSLRDIINYSFQASSDFSINLCPENEQNLVLF